MKASWHWALVPPLVVAAVLLVASQYVFLKGSLHADLGVGRLGTDITAANYARVLSDSFYLGSLWLTVKISALATLFTLVLGFPVAYMLARMNPGRAMVLLATITAASFITIVIKVLGLTILFGTTGPVNSALLGLGLLDRPISILGTVGGVVMGLMYFTLAFLVILLYGVIASIPRSLEDAAHLLGANRLRVYLRVIVPLALPGVIAASLIAFNLCMGAFTSAALLGAGKVLTLPVLIQRTIISDTKYGMGATLAVVLLVVGLLINLVSLHFATRAKGARGMAT
jgi:putative spermidine/putrescine transport system permease protein